MSKGVETLSIELSLGAKVYRGDDKPGDRVCLDRCGCNSRIVRSCGVVKGNMESLSLSVGNV